MATKGDPVPAKNRSDGYINVHVTKQTREGLHHLKQRMSVRSQEEVIELLVKWALATEKLFAEK